MSDDAMTRPLTAEETASWFAAGGLHLIGRRQRINTVRGRRYLIGDGPTRDVTEQTEPQR